MEIHKDSGIFNENGDPSFGLPLLKRSLKSEVAGTGSHYPRTPLTDVNKNSQRTSEMKPSRKFSIDSSCTSQDVLSQLIMEAPKRQECSTKSRKSCFAVFNVPEDLSACENKTMGVTLPRAVEEEPETFMLQNQVQFGGVSELSGGTRASIKDFKSKSVASLYEVLKAKDLSAFSDRAVGATLPQVIEEEPEMSTLQNEGQFGGVSELTGAGRTKVKGFKSKSVANLYEVLKSKDLDAHVDGAVGAALPQVIKEVPEMRTGVSELIRATGTSKGRLSCKSDESLCEKMAFKDNSDWNITSSVSLPGALKEPKIATYMMLDVGEVKIAPDVGMGRLSSKSDESAYKTFAFISAGSHKTINAGVTLPNAVEEEPETLQSQMLSGLCGRRSEITTNLKNFKTQTYRSQRESVTSLESQSHFSLGEPSELTVLCDRKEIQNKGSLETNVHHITCCGPDGCSPDSNVDDGATSDVGLSCEIRARTQNSTASLFLHVMSQFEKERDGQETMQLKGCPADFPEKSDAPSSVPENAVSSLLQDHQYSKAPASSEENLSPSELTEQSLLAPALSNTSHSPQDLVNLQEQHSSTPKSAGNLSTFQGFVTPHLSSSFDFMNISNSSFQEELQRANLDDLIKSYLHQSSIPAIDLSAVVEIHDKDQSSCRASSPDHSFADLLKSPVVYPSGRSLTDVTDVQLSSEKLYNLGADRGSELELDCGDGSVSFVGGDSVLFVTDKVVDSGVMCSSDVPTYLTSDICDTDFLEIHRADLSDKLKTLDVNQEMCRAGLSESMLDSQVIEETDMTYSPNVLENSQEYDVNQVDLVSELRDVVLENNSDLPDMLQVSEVTELNQVGFPNVPQDVDLRTSRIDCPVTNENNVFLDDCVRVGREPIVNAHTGGTVEVELIPDMGVCVSEVEKHLSQEGYTGPVADHQKPSADESLCKGSTETLMDGSRVHAGTNTFDTVQASISVLSHQQNFVSTSMGTDGCLVNVQSVLTDQQNLINTSMLTDGCLVKDVSVLTDQQNFVNTSMLTDGCLVSDVSVMANMCQGIDVSMVTDTCHGCDISLLTDKVDMSEHSVMVIPECQTQETMTERQVMVDTSSSMTPLKLSKQGKRLTAEEIRRQHPRIVANQLDTLLATNQRLQKEVDTVVHNRDNLKSVLAEAKTKLASADRQLTEEKDRQGGVISIIEQYHQKTVASLEASVKNKEGIIDSLQSELREMKQKYEEAQGKWRSDNVDLQEKCAQLEKFKSEAEDHIAEETKKLKLQFEEKSYYHAFLASQQVIKEMQAEQKEFAELLNEVERSASFQKRLQDLLGPLIRKSKEFVSVQDRLTKQKQAMQKQLTSLQTDLDIALSENKDLHEDIQNINDILKRSNDNYVELETTYQAAKEDICESQAKVTELNSKIEFGYKLVKDLMTVKADLTAQVTEYQERFSEQTEKLKSAEEEVQMLMQQIGKERKLMDAKSEYYEQVIADHEASKSRLEMSIENLRDTLDSWEVDRDVQSKLISDLEEELDKQRAKMEEMSKELQSLRKVKAVTQPERDYYQELRSASKFLEAEKQLYLEALTDCRTRLEAEVQLTASNNKLIEALRSNNAELQQSNDQLLSDVQMLEENLALKSTDIDMSCTAMDNLQERMESVLSSLQQKLVHKVKPDNSVRETFFTPSKLSSNFQESSIITQILSARKARQPISHASDAPFAQQRCSVLQSTCVNQDSSSLGRTEEAEKTRLKQNNVQFGALQPRLCAEAESHLSPRSQSFIITSQKSRTLTDSKRSLQFSSTSKVTFKNPDVSQSSHRPQTSVRKDLSSLYPTTEQNVSTPGYAKICSIPSTMDRTLENMARAKGESFRSVSMGNSSLEDGSSCVESDSMLAKVQLVDTLFKLIVKNADMSQRASELTVKDLKEDIALLEDKLKFQRCQAKDLETELMQKSAQLASAKSQIQELNSRMREKTQSLMNFQDQQHQVTTLEEEKTELNRKVRALREEVKMLTDQLHEVLQKFDDKTGQKPEGACLREIVYLKKRNHELIMKLFDERDNNKDVEEKAVRRMKILDINWRKAEAEVKKYDELVEQIRETCIASQAQSTHPVILQVVRLIDGVE